MDPKFTRMVYLLPFKIVWEDCELNCGKVDDETFALPSYFSYIVDVIELRDGRRAVFCTKPTEAPRLNSFMVGFAAEMNPLPVTTRQLGDLEAVFPTQTTTA